MSKVYIIWLLQRDNPTKKFCATNNSMFVLQYEFITTNLTAWIRHQCRKTTVLTCHRCPINAGVEKMNNI
jgi:hypothetical protein